MAEKIKITTQYLRAKKEEWSEFAAQAEKHFFQAADTGDEICRCFWGLPVCRIKTDFLSVRSEGEAVFGALREHMNKLGEIAGIYEEAERSNKGVVTDN